MLLFAAAVAAHVAQIVIHPQFYWQQTDESVYRAAGAAVLGHHGMLYSLRLGSPRLPFTYPPFAALLFAAASPFSFASWQLALAAASILMLPAIAHLSLGLAGHGPGAGRIAGALALAAASLWLEPVQKTLLFGQLNLLLLVLVVADLAMPDTRRWKGVGIGMAAGIKLTPLIFIPYLLLTRRRRAALAGLVTFVVTVVLGFVLLPGDAGAYWDGGFGKPGDSPERLVNQSINGAIQRAMHGGTAAVAVWLGLAALMCAAGLATAAAASRHGRELLGIVVCGVTGLLVSPISWTHHWVYVIPGLALAACKTVRPAVTARSGDARLGAVGTGAVGTGAVGTGAVGTGAVGTGAVGTGAVGTGAVGTGKQGRAHAYGPSGDEVKNEDAPLRRSAAGQDTPLNGTRGVVAPARPGEPGTLSTGHACGSAAGGTSRTRLLVAARLAGAAAVLGLFGMWPARSGPNGYYDPGAAFVPRGLLRFAPHNFGLEYHWYGLEFVLGNYYVLAGIVFVAATAAYLAVMSNQTRSDLPVKPSSTSCG